MSNDIHVCVCTVQVHQECMSVAQGKIKTKYTPPIHIQHKLTAPHIQTKALTK